MNIALIICKNTLKYSIRIPKSRVVSINGIEAQLKNHKVFGLKKMKNIKWQKALTKARKCTLLHKKERGRKEQLKLFLSQAT